MKNSLVSIIIPTHKGSEVILNAIDSVLKQTYKDIEIIVVDDNGMGSEEQIKTAKTLENLISDKKIKYIIHEKNKNGSAARNTGFKNSNGEYFCLLDDDDTYFPEKIEKQVNEFQQLNGDYAIVLSATAIYQNGALQSTRKQIVDGYVFKDVLLHEIVINTNALMIRRNCYEELGGFDEEFFRHQDYEFSARVAFKWKIKSIPYIGVKYNTLHRNDPKNISIAMNYRAFFLMKMYKYMESFSDSTKHLIIGANMCQVVGKRKVISHPIKYYKIIIYHLLQNNLNLSFSSYLGAIIYLLIHRKAA